MKKDVKKHVDIKSAVMNTEKNKAVTCSYKELVKKK